MMKKVAVAFSVAMLVLLPVAVAQWGGRGERPLPDRGDFPTWETPAGFKYDVFTLARIKYSSYASGRGSRWSNDYPDSDWIFSYRLQQITAMQVDPMGRVLELTDPELFDYPFIFINGVGALDFSVEEAECLRRYLNNGGFMMVDDFWGDGEWENMKFQMSKVLPNQTPIDLPLEHEIFHLVYDLPQKPQVPDIRTWRSGRKVEDHGPTSDTQPHFQAYRDSQNRIVALLCHNNDLGDGWEREGENHDYFAEFSVPWSYPMGINIVSYAMTH